MWNFSLMWWYLSSDMFLSIFSFFVVRVYWNNGLCKRQIFTPANKVAFTAFYWIRNATNMWCLAWIFPIPKSRIQPVSPSLSLGRLSNGKSRTKNVRQIFRRPKICCFSSSKYFSWKRVKQIRSGNENEEHKQAQRLRLSGKNEREMCCSWWSFSRMFDRLGGFSTNLWRRSWLKYVDF